MIITEASAPNPSCNSMNMEGVEESPVKITFPPQPVIASATSAEMCPAERRESCPTAIVGDWIPDFAAAHT